MYNPRNPRMLTMESFDESNKIEPCLENFKIVKEFDHHTEKINNIDFSFDGELLVSGSKDKSINAFHCLEGRHVCTFNSYRYGVGTVQFSHDKNILVHSSTEGNDFLCMTLSLENLQYINLYRGHNDRITSICMSPADDIFLTSSDKEVRLWGLDTCECLGALSIPGTGILSFDPEGVVFAVGFNSDTINMYNMINFDDGPFSIFCFSQLNDCDWTGLKFSPDGITILISTNGTVIHVIDAFDGSLLKTLDIGCENLQKFPIEASFSPNTEYIFCGSTDKRVNVWNAESREKVTDLYSNEDVVQCVKFNPAYMCMATAYSKVDMWLPDEVAPEEFNRVNVETEEILPEDDDEEYEIHFEYTVKMRRPRSLAF